MSVQSEINRITEKIEDAYGAVADMGGTLPPASQQNINNLADSIYSIPTAGGPVSWEDIVDKPSKFSASTVLLNVSSSAQQTIANFMDYTYIIAVLYHTAESSHFSGIVIPCRKITTSSTGAGFGTSTTSPGDQTNVGNFYQGASDTVYSSIAAWYSGTTGYLTVRGATTSTSSVRFRCIIGVK